MSVLACPELLASNQSVKTNVSAPEAGNAQRPRLAIKVRGKILIVNLDEVYAVHAEGNYVLLHRGSNSYLLRQSLSGLANTLEPFGFLRIHRSVLINSAQVEEIKPLPNGKYLLRVKGGMEFTVTRTYKKNLHSLAGFWIGVGSSFQQASSITPDVNLS